MLCTDYTLLVPICNLYLSTRTGVYQRYLNKGLGIDIDFYSLKHLNLDETSSILDAEAASKMAGHSSPVITLKHYLINEEQRELEKLKRVNNRFA
ncbi:MAG: hypothetical protein J0H55_06650 [Chitinophagaceae bacterium]|nr:hypothetical protein [Chitinophagaceae bacterium]